MTFFRARIQLPLRRAICPPLAACIALAGGALAAPRAPANDVADGYTASGLLRVASDYIQRGYSKTEDGPSLQLHGAVTAPARGALSGFYAGAWLNRVNLGGARWEAAPYLGWRRALGPDWQVDGTLAGYLYDDPFNARDAHEAHYAELHVAVHYRDWLSAGAGVALAPYGFDGTAPEVELKLRRPLSDILLASASIGHAWLDDYAGYEVTHYALGVGCLLGTRAQADLRWHGALSGDERAGAPAHDVFERLLIDDRIVASISVSF